MIYYLSNKYSEKLKRAKKNKKIILKDPYYMGIKQKKTTRYGWFCNSFFSFLFSVDVNSLWKDNSNNLRLIDF